jgi:hypothetical protein
MAKIKVQFTFTLTDEPEWFAECTHQGKCTGREFLALIASQIAFYEKQFGKMPEEIRKQLFEGQIYTFEN